MFSGQNIFKNGNMLFCPILIIYVYYTYNIAYRDGHGKTMCVYIYAYLFLYILLTTPCLNLLHLFLFLLLVPQRLWHVFWTKLLSRTVVAVVSGQKSSSTLALSSIQNPMQNKTKSKVTWQVRFSGFSTGMCMYLFMSVLCPNLATVDQAYFTHNSINSFLEEILGTSCISYIST